MQACKLSPQLAEVLLAAGARIDAPVSDDGQTALHVMAHFPHPAAVEWLLAHGASPNATTVDGRTPLHRAAERNAGPRVAQMLLAAGADPHIRNATGQTPLAVARANHKTRVAAFLRRSMRGGKRGRCTLSPGSVSQE